MALIITVSVIVTFLSAIPFFMAFLISLNRFIKERYSQNLYMMLAWLFFLFWDLGLVFSEMYLSIPTKMFANYALIPAAFSIILLMDSVSREHVDPIKLSIIHVLSALVVFLSLQPDAFRIGYREGQTELSVMSGGHFKIVGSLFLILIGFFVFNMLFRIHKQAPKNLKNYSTLNLTGGILIGIVTPLGYFLGFSVILPGSTTLLMSIGTVFIAIAFARRPLLGYILPFKATKIMVVHSVGGQALFTHTWTLQDTIDEVLFSGMMQGISGILNETVNKGNIREIKMDSGILILERNPDHPIACILVANKSTNSLRDALNSFNSKFCEVYKSCFNNHHEVSQFDTATKLIDEFFPFVPVYD